MEIHKELPYPELVKLLDLFNNNPAAVVPNVLYLGDSVLLRVSDADRNKQTLDQLVSRKLGRNFRLASIAHSAYHMRVYYNLLKVLEKTSHRPKIVVLPVNIRSFSPQWDDNPLWQCNNEIEIITAYLADPDRQIPVVEEIVETPELYEKFDSLPVEYPFTELKRVGQFRELIKSRPVTPEAKINRKKQIFIFHYMHCLKPSHDKLMALGKILELLTDLDIAALIYVTPINFQAGIKFIGSPFLDVVRDNIKVVSDVVHPYAKHQDKRVVFLDCSVQLGAQNFFNEDDPTEHLNQAGRERLAGFICGQLAAMKRSITDEAIQKN